MYGEYSYTLQEAYLTVPNHIDPASVPEHESQSVNEIIDTMNRHELYVDGTVRDKWIDGNQGRQVRSDRVEEHVRHVQCKLWVKLVHSCQADNCTVKPTDLQILYS